MTNVNIRFIRITDSSEHLKEEGIALSSDCNLIGTKNTKITKSFSHVITVDLNSVITVVYNTLNGFWHMADNEGNYDTKWYLNEHLALENVKLMQGLVIRGTLKDISFHRSKKYCKQLEINRDLKFFTKNKIPVMTAKILYIDGGVWGKGIK